jgi:hypothetical protein
MDESKEAQGYPEYPVHRTDVRRRRRDAGATRLREEHTFREEVKDVSCGDGPVGKQ